MQTQTRPLYDISEVARMLAADMENLCHRLLPGGRRQGAEWTCGSVAGEPGTRMSVHLHGPKAGVWKDFAADEGGDAMDLVAACLFGGDKKQAFAWSRQWLGIEQGGPALEERRRAMPDPEKQRKLADDEAEKIRASAKRVWFGAQYDLTDTPVDWYLRARGIRLDKLVRPPGAIRYAPELWNDETKRHWPAMVSQIIGPSGFMAIHRTWLEVTAPGQAQKAPLDNPKKTLGTYRGGHIPIARGESNKAIAQAPAGETVDITEGIEDALSVAQAIPECRVVAAVSLSNLAALALPSQLKSVRIWRQNDTHPAAISAFERALTAQIKADRDVIIPQMPKGVKDVNDWLRALIEAPPNVG